MKKIFLVALIILSFIPSVIAFAEDNNELSYLIEEDSNFLVEQKVRIAGSKEWLEETIEAEIGDVIEFQTQYKNLSEATQRDVSFRDILPNNLCYIEGSTVLYNGNYPDGKPIESDDIIDSGINIGNYAGSANAYVRFQAKVVAEISKDGETTNWIQVQARLEDDHQLILKDVIVVCPKENGLSEWTIVIIALVVALLLVIVIIVSALRYSKRAVERMQREERERQQEEEMDSDPESADAR